MTPDHAIRTKAVPLVAAGAARPASSTHSERGGEGRARGLRRATITPISRATTCRQMPSKTELDPDAARRAGAGAGPVRRRQHREGRQDRRRPRRDDGRGGAPTPSDSAHTSRSPSPTCSTWSTGRSSRPSSASRPRSRWRAASSWSPAAPRASARATAAGLRQGRRGGRGARPRRVDGQGLRHRLRRHRRRPRCARRSTRSPRPSAASISWSPTRGAAWQGRIGDVDDATLRQSFELNFWAHQSVAQNAVRVMRAQGTGRLPAVQHLQAGGQSRPGFRPLRPAQGGDSVPDAAIRARPRRRRHPRQRRQRRPHPLGPADRRDDRPALQGARPERSRTTWAAICWAAR